MWRESYDEEGRIVGLESDCGEELEQEMLAHMEDYRWIYLHKHLMSS